MIRGFAVLGFVVGFAVVLAVPLAIIDAALRNPPVSALPEFTQADVRLAAGVMGLGLLLSGFSVVLWMVAEPREG